MLYVIVATDNSNTKEMRKQHRSAHVERLNILKQQGQLIIAGPNPVLDTDNTDFGATGSIIIAEFDTLDDATNWANFDPYVLHGIYKEVIIKPFIKALP